MFYHYTSLNALQGILQRETSGKPKLCFWATRYDCFEDPDEYLLGIDTLKKLLPIWEEKFNVLEDIRIANLFEKDKIKGNINLPHPYVISVSARNDNDYMWENYADHRHGVVLALNIKSMFGKCNAATLYRIEKCLYEQNVSEEYLLQEIDKTYTDVGLSMLQEGQQNAFFILKYYPQLFTKLIAVLLLAFFAPRMKRHQFEKEEETRIILSVPTQAYADIRGVNDIKRYCQKTNIDFNLGNILREIRNEKVRPDNGNFYREAFMPISVLDKIYVLDDDVKKKTEKMLKDKVYSNIQVVVLNNIMVEM